MAEQPVRPSAVVPRRLSGLLERLGGSGLAGVRLQGDADTEVSGISHDSRSVRPGDLYVARSGANTHGVAHVSAALGAGAAAVLTDPASSGTALEAGAATVVVVDDPRRAMGPAAAWTYGDPAESLLLLGVTGTNGKTTTSYLLEAGLRGAGRRTGLIGTIETRIDGAAVPSARTTPEATELHALLALMRERGVDAVAMEVSSHALALGRVDAVVFDVAAFMNLSQDHLDFHHDMAGYYAAKASLFTPERASLGVVNVDDSWGVRLAGEATVPVTTVGAGSGASWRRHGEVPSSATSAGSVRLTGPDGTTVAVGCGLLGHVNLVNAATAFVVLASAGIDGDRAAEGIAALRSVPGRLEPVDAGQPFFALVDYAHTPAAVTAVLADARALAAPGARVLVVIGCGGDRDREKRPLMGRAAASGADLAIFTNDNPRSEDPGEILAAMQRDLPAGTQVAMEPDRSAAIAAAVGLARAGDVLVVAGKGHEQGQETAGVVVPFDDRAVLRAAISAHLGVA